VDPKTTLSALKWAVRKWLDIEAWWMNVRIDGPRSRDKVSFSRVIVEGTYRTDLRKELVLFHRAGNVYFPQGSPVLGETKGR
jgi:hypothetical protein